MAVGDIRVDTGFPRHRKTMHLSRLVGSGAIGHLVTFWVAVALQCPDGDLDGWSERDVENAAGWSGEPGKLVAALLETRFLDATDTGFTPHDWKEHQPWVIGAKKRSEAAKNAGKASGKSRKKSSGSNGKRTVRSQSVQQNVRTPSPSPSPLPCMENTPSSSSGSEHLNSSRQRASAKSPPAPLALPSWLSPIAWNDWCEYRKAAKKPLTRKAQVLSISKLERLRADGHDPTAVIEQSIERGWTGLFKIDEAKSNNGRNGHKQTQEEIEDVFRQAGY